MPVLTLISARDTVARVTMSHSDRANNAGRVLPARAEGLHSKIPANVIYASLTGSLDFTQVLAYQLRGY